MISFDRDSKNFKPGAVMNSSVRNRQFCLGLEFNASLGHSLYHDTRRRNASRDGNPVDIIVPLCIFTCPPHPKRHRICESFPAHCC